MTPKTKTALIISGIALGAIGVGYLGYRIYIALTKDVIKGDHNTILVEKEINYDEVESVGWEEEESSMPPEWYSQLEEISDEELEKYLQEYGYDY